MDANKDNGNIIVMDEMWHKTSHDNHDLINRLSKENRRSTAVYDTRPLALPTHQISDFMENEIMENFYTKEQLLAQWHQRIQEIEARMNDVFKQMKESEEENPFLKTAFNVLLGERKAYSHARRELMLAVEQREPGS